MKETVIKHVEHFHGSDLEKIEKIYGIDKNQIVSFSANVNPLGLSKKLKEELSAHLDVLTSYPDREYTELRKVIANYCNTLYTNVVVGNGSTELISLFIKTLSPRRALVIAPTYSEYEHELSLCGASTDYFLLNEADDFRPDIAALTAKLSEGYNMLVVCNPNNPTSYAIRNTELEVIANVCKEQSIFMLIDETYVEFAPDLDEITAIPLTEKYDNLAILRGVSKFYAAPGLRLGYAVTGNQDLIADVISQQNAWSINSLAEAAGRLMFTDESFKAATKELIFKERTRIFNELMSIPGLKPYVPSANFILVKILEPKLSADIIFDAAIRQGLMIRNCSTFVSLDNSYFRLCIMLPEDNDRLIKCIKETVKSVQ